MERAGPLQIHSIHEPRDGHANATMSSDQLLTAVARHNSISVEEVPCYHFWWFKRLVRQYGLRTLSGCSMKSRTDSISDLTKHHVPHPAWSGWRQIPLGACMPRPSVKFQISKLHPALAAEVYSAIQPEIHILQTGLYVPLWYHRILTARGYTS